MLTTSKNLLLASFIIALSSCTFLEGNQKTNHENLCKQIKSKILMAGATYNERVAQQQNADLGRLNASFREQGCE